MPIRVSATLADPPQLQRQEKNNRKKWNVKASNCSTGTVNTIRRLIENMKLVPNPEKKVISLSIGDPTVAGHLKPCDEILQAVEKSMKSFRYNGYAPSTGHLDAREAVAQYATLPGAPIEAKDVILTSGCSQALELAICALANPGQTILVPRPGFPLYKTLAESMGINIKYYSLLPEKSWEVDLADLEHQISVDTAAIVVNNPSNPCGSVYSRRHLQSILEVAARNYVPIIADEIYEHFVFPGEEFYPIASMSLSVPILTCSGLTKRFLVPGWRMGWILIHDRNEVFGSAIRNGLQSLCQRIMGSNTIIQGAIPDILRDTPKSFFQETILSVKTNAAICYSVLAEIPGLMPIMPAGAMYMMVGIDVKSFNCFKNDMEFVERLMCEQSVMCLPGTCFEYPNYVRLVLTVPEDDIRDACRRITEFCQKYSKFSFTMENSPVHTLPSTTLYPIDESLETVTENSTGVIESPLPIRV
ncbi:tyrosine aminotransferase [Parasteatoda tepidariorum]|uniref:tyrosine aminotransferase n=1 Tax=Parasteatoda tepidariorum TaxID=114398 RepID=UPI00077FE18C|nr:tyrosine aminotransferase [Parasteatoda tepidariorum]